MNHAGLLFVTKGNNGLDVGDLFTRGVHTDAQGFQKIQGLGVTVRAGRFAAGHGVGKKLQTASGDHRSVQQLQRTGGGIATIGKGRFVIGKTFLLADFEGRIGHEHFAANLQQVGNGIIGE